MTIEIFSKWLKGNSTLSESSIKHYSGAIQTISNEMIDYNVINKSLYNMSLIELDISIANIINNNYFIKKNKTGDSMYRSAIKWYRYYLSNFSDSEEDATIILTTIENSTISSTEKETIIKSRRGQGQYRKNLFKKYNGKCIVTGIDNSKLLIASHIKPWSMSENNERIDMENGLLLSANMDRLFDSGLISFKNSGKMMISSLVGQENENRLNISKGIIVDLKPTNSLLKYLEYHRDVLYIK